MATTPEQFHNTHTPSPETTLRQGANQDSAKLFDEVLKDKFEQIPPGTFKSDLPGVDWIAFEPFRKIGKDGKKAFYAKIAYPAEHGKIKTETWIVMDDGRFLGQVPKELTRLSSKKDIELEILRLLKAINMDFWHITDRDIIPGSDEGNPKGGAGIERGELKPNPVDEERLKFLETQKRSLFGSRNRRKGFDGYVIIYFLPRTKGKPLVMVLDNERKGNAAFVYTAPEGTSLNIDESVLSLPQSERFSEEEKKQIEEMFWGPVDDRTKTRGGLRNLGAARIIHKGEDWKKRLQEAFDEATQ